MTGLIEAIASKTRNPGQRPFQISLDLKKLNSGGKSDDVNCWGHEVKSSLKDRLDRFHREKTDIEVLINNIDTI